MPHAGIIEPVRSGVDEGIRLGLGKQEQDDVYTNAENVVRKRLETEIQADEDVERKERREVIPGGVQWAECLSRGASDRCLTPTLAQALAEREAKIKMEVSDIKKTFLCEVNDKRPRDGLDD